MEETQQKILDSRGEAKASFESNSKERFNLVYLALLCSVIGLGPFHYGY